MSGQIPKLQDNVVKFINKCAREVGKFEEEAFDRDMFCECLDQKMESPIEQILYVALNTIRRLNWISDGDPVAIEGVDFILGLEVWPQREIGKYRVDFIVGYGRYPKRGEKGYYQEWKEVIVECDSQAFHERTEPERRHEKARDRFLQSKGHKIFRFTGTEIVREPMRVAKEIISYVTGIDTTDLLEDSNWE